MWCTDSGRCKPTPMAFYALYRYLENYSKCVRRRNALNLAIQGLQRKQHLDKWCLMVYVSWQLPINWYETVSLCTLTAYIPNREQMGLSFPLKVECSMWKKGLQKLAQRAIIALYIWQFYCKNTQVSFQEGTVHINNASDLCCVRHNI